MFAATALTLLSGAALVSAAGLRSAAVSQYGSADGDLILKQLGNDFVVGSAQAETTISATVAPWQETCGQNFVSHSHFVFR